MYRADMYAVADKNEMQFILVELWAPVVSLDWQMIDPYVQYVPNVLPKVTF